MAALLSSSPPPCTDAPDYRSRRSPAAAWNVFDSRPLHSAEAGDIDDENEPSGAGGLLSPSFDASFASSMSLSSAASGPSSNEHMEVSPASRCSSGKLAPPVEFNQSFFAQLASHKVHRPGQGIPTPEPDTIQQSTSSPDSPCPESPSDHRSKPSHAPSVHARVSHSMSGRSFGSSISPNIPRSAQLPCPTPAKESLPPKKLIQHSRTVSDGVTLKSSKRPREHSSRKAPPPPLPMNKIMSTQNNAKEDSQPLSCPADPPTSTNESHSKTALQVVPGKVPTGFVRHHTQPVFRGEGNWANLDVFKKHASSDHYHVTPGALHQFHSPAPMEVDSSPHIGKNSPNSSLLGEAFNDPSPIPAPKRRVVFGQEAVHPGESSLPSIELSSPSSYAANAANTRPILQARPVLEKAASTMGLPFASGVDQNSSQLGVAPRRRLSSRGNASNTSTSVHSRPPLLKNRSASSAENHQGSDPEISKANFAAGRGGFNPDLPHLGKINRQPLTRFHSASLSIHAHKHNTENEDVKTNRFSDCTDASPSPSRLPQSSSTDFHFGSEAEGKILPCFSVKEDGLMRIKPNTLADLLEGRYDGLVAEYVLIDCRFEYEYSGGHFRGAINLPTQEAVESYFLSENAPRPSKSGEPDEFGNTRKIVLVFHCEYSAKRAPTMAKHLRHMDRKVNGKVYPKVHYPDVYILDGGYAESFRQFPDHCEPRGYRSMDDPEFLAKRAADLNEFRKIRMGVRARSFTFGEKSSQGLIQPRESSRPVSYTKGSTSSGTVATSRKEVSGPSSASTAGKPSLAPFSLAPACELRAKRGASHTRHVSNTVNDAIAEESEGLTENDASLQNEHSSQLDDSPCPGDRFSVGTPKERSNLRMFVTNANDSTERNADTSLHLADPTSSPAVDDSPCPVVPKRGTSKEDDKPSHHRLLMR